MEVHRELEAGWVQYRPNPSAVTVAVLTLNERKGREQRVQVLLIEGGEGKGEISADKGEES